MPLITKPDYEFIWASGGAIVEPSDVKKQLGWTPEVPPHQWENWIQNRQDQYIAHVNQRGIPEWDGNTEYEAGGLSYAQGSDGLIYKSVAASGPSTTTQDPTTDVTDTYWTRALITQSEGDARYLQKTNNLTDLASALTSFNNIKQNASETYSGVVEFATPAETVTGLSDVLATHPAGVLAALTAYLPKRSFAATDFVRIPDVPGGLIIQWGGGGAFAVNSVFNFATPFPNAIRSLAVMEGSADASAGNMHVVGYDVDVLTTSSWTMLMRSIADSTAGATNLFYIAIGY